MVVFAFYISALSFLADTSVLPLFFSQQSEEMFSSVSCALHASVLPFFFNFCWFSVLFLVESLFFFSLFLSVVLICCCFFFSFLVLGMKGGSRLLWISSAHLNVEREWVICLSPRGRQACSALCVDTGPLLMSLSPNNDACVSTDAHTSNYIYPHVLDYTLTEIILYVWISTQ